MKKTTALALTMLISICSYAQIFMGIPVSGTLTSFTAQLKAKGFVYVPSESTPTFAVLNGTVSNQSVQLMVVGTPTTKMTAKLVVFYPEQATWSTLKSQFEEMTLVFTQKYGTPDETYGFFSSPYEEGDGYEMTAVSVEKSFFMSVWKPNAKYPNQTLAVRITKSQRVTLVYENNQTMALKDEEQSKIDENTF